MNPLANLHRTYLTAAIALSIAAAFAYALHRDRVPVDSRLERIQAERRARHQALKPAARKRWRELSEQHD